MKRIGVISDTHGKLPEQIFEIFDKVDFIFHSGDVGGNNIISRLRKCCEVVAVRGNMDSGTTSSLPVIIKHSIGGKRILLTHVLGSPETPASKIEREIDSYEPDIVIFGHTHRPYYRKMGGIIYFNPGSATSGRRGSQRTVGLIKIKEGEIECVHRVISR